MRGMRDSGVEWIGEVPQNWKQSKVKYLMSLTNGRAYKQQELLAKGTYRVLRVGNFNTNDKWYYSDLELPEKQYCEKGDLLYLWATTFGPAFWNEEKVIYHYHIWKVDQFRDYLQRYAFYALGANAEWQRMQSHGSTMVHVTKEGVENTVFPAPPLPEQRRIVAFLDERCAAIDADIAKRREVIEKLGEYKKSIIAKAVTKGLDTDAEMKDSGVEWIGEVPVNWSVLRGKHVYSLLARPVEVDDGVITCFRDGEVTLRSNRRDEGFTIADKEIGYQGIEPGDLVVHGMDGFAGSIGISDSRGKATPVLRVLDSSENKRYLMYLLRTYANLGVYLSIADGIRVRSCNLSWGKLAELSILVPPADEQHCIAAFLDERCAAIDDAVSREEQIIAKLGEYRKSLIHHAVTGKIDCREAANAR